MPEYKRFIAYFYEYIDGRKQKNAGFAKVELRNGMWRILFRIRTDQMPEAPVQVFGFVRERGYLLGFLLGNMNSGYEISEEWAYGAEKVIGHEKYRFGNLSGVWIQSGDGRKFITVWDDDPIDVQRFLLKMPEPAEDKDTEKISKQLIDENSENTSIRLTDEDTENISEKAADGNVENMPEQAADGNVENVPEKTSDENTEKTLVALQEKNIGIVIEQSSKGKKEESQETEENKNRNMECWLADLFSRRKHVQPFSDDQLHECIQIRPCDLMMLQQKGWQAGRSSFLQHGFYQYHHLLLGKNADGDYILGVPGIRNAQEQYMAQLFGYNQFLLSKVYECGKVFGYWCRKL